MKYSMLSIFCKILMILFIVLLCFCNEDVDTYYTYNIQITNNSLNRLVKVTTMLRFASSSHIIDSIEVDESSEHFSLFKRKLKDGESFWESYGQLLFKFNIDTITSYFYGPFNLGSEEGLDIDVKIDVMNDTLILINNIEADYSANEWIEY